jgi:hypothetical protein
MGLCFSFCLAETPLFERNFIRQKLNIARVIGCLSYENYITFMC